MGAEITPKFCVIHRTRKIILNPVVVSGNFFSPENVIPSFKVSLDAAAKLTSLKAKSKCVFVCARACACVRTCACVPVEV